MADRTVTVNLVGKATSLLASFESAAAGAKALDAEMQGLGKKSPQKFNEISKAAGGLGLALLGVAAYAVKASADFDKQMSEVGAVSNASVAQMNQLRAAALQAGKDTAFSATQAAQAEAELSKAGISVSDIMGGALSGSLALASAGQLNLADAATIASQTMNEFQLKGQDVGHIADVLASAANVSAADMEGLGQGLRQVGLVAHQAGFSLEETVGVLAAFADRGLQGADGATSLKTAIQRLTAPTGQAAALMQSLGINVYGANGQVKSAAELAGNLQQSLGGLTAEQRNAAMQTIFGSDAIRAANVLYTLGADGVKKYTDAVNKNGSAAETARKKMDNLAGDFEQLKGSVETLAITSGSGLNGFLRLLTEGVTGLANAFLSMPKGVTETFLMLATIGGVVLTAGAAFMKLRKSVGDTMQSLRDMGPAGTKAATAIGAVGKVAGIAGAAIVGVQLVTSGLAAATGQATPDVDALTRSLQKYADTGKLSGEALKVTGANLKSFRSDLSMVTQSGAGFGQWAEGVLGLDKFSFSISAAKDRITDISKSLADMVSSGHGVEAAVAFDQLAAAAQRQGISLSQPKGMMPEYANALAGAGAAAGGAAAGAANVAAQTKIMTGTLDAAIQAGQTLKNTFDSLNGATISMEQAEIAVEQKIDDLTASLSKNGNTFDINSQKGRENYSGLLDVATGARDAAQAIYDQTGSLSQADGAYNSYIGRLRATLSQAGLTQSQIDGLVGSISRMPPLKSTNIQTPGAVASSNEVNKVNNELDRLDGRTASASVTLHEIHVQSVINHVQNTLDRFPNVQNRWGGVYEKAAVGTLRDASVYSSANPGRYMIAEPETGGEAFIPKHGNRARSMGILRTAASWLGTTVGERGSSVYSPSYAITVNASPGVSGPEVGAGVVKVIKEYERANGKGWRG